MCIIVNLIFAGVFCNAWQFSYWLLSL